MNNKKILLGTLVCALLTSVTWAQEQAGDDSVRGPRTGQTPRMMPEELVKLYDKDGDGKLSREEMDAMREDLNNAMKQYDKDDDQRLNTEELEALKKDNPQLAEMIARRQQMMAERAPGAQRMPVRQPVAQAPQIPDEIVQKAVDAFVKKYDKDGDGKLGVEELSAALKENPQLVRAMLPQPQSDMPGRGHGPQMRVRAPRGAQGGEAPAAQE